MKRRRHIAEVNIRLCFPDMPEHEQRELVRKNMENTGIAMMETGMAWWWPEWRVKKYMAPLRA